MSMSLTKDDLQAIKDIVGDAIEDSKLHTAAGFAGVDEKFAEVHEKFDEVHYKIDQAKGELKADIKQVDDKLSVKDGKLENTVQRVDNHDEQITKINKKLTFAK